MTVCISDHCELNPSRISKGTAQVDCLARIRRYLWLHLHSLGWRSWEKERNISACCFLFSQIRIWNNERVMIKISAQLPDDERGRSLVKPRTALVNPDSAFTTWLWLHLRMEWPKREKGKFPEIQGEASSLLNIGHKSSGWVLLLYSLPFAVPTHSCITATSQNKYAFFGVLCQWVCE